jgi:hypothetical protein
VFPAQSIAQRFHDTTGSQSEITRPLLVPACQAYHASAYSSPSTAAYPASATGGRRTAIRGISARHLTRSRSSASAGCRARRHSHTSITSSTATTA